MSGISFVGVNGDEKAVLLGPEFRNIDVLDCEAVDGTFIVNIINSELVTLVGDPSEALRTYLASASTPGEIGSA